MQQTFCQGTAFRINTGGGTALHHARISGYNSVPPKSAERWAHIDLEELQKSAKTSTIPGVCLYAAICFMVYIEGVLWRNFCCWFCIGPPYFASWELTECYALFFFERNRF